MISELLVFMSCSDEAERWLACLNDRYVLQYCVCYLACMSYLLSGDNSAKSLINSQSECQFNHQPSLQVIYQDMPFNFRNLKINSTKSAEEFTQHLQMVE